MKKIILMLTVIVVCCGSYAYANSFNARGGADMGGKMKLSVSGVGSESYKPPMGFSLSAEIMFTVHEYVEIGGGGEYQFPRDLDKDIDTIEYNFIPIYALIRIPFKLESITPYVTLKLGYNIAMSDDVEQLAGDSASLEGGLFYGFGAGLVYEFVIFEFTYTMNNGEISGEDPWGDPATVEIENSKVTISAGINIDFSDSSEY